MGTGIERIHEALKKEHCPPVKIEYSTMFSLVFPRPSFISPWETQKPREKTRGDSREKTREKILALLKKTPDMTTAQLAEETGLTPKGIEWQMARIKKKGLIERIGPARGGSWKIKKS